MSISDSAISRLIKKVNKDTHNINSLVYDEVRNILITYINNLLGDCTTIVSYCGKKTISSKYVYSCLQYTPATVPTNTKRCSASKKVKEEDFCFCIPKETFRRFVRKIGNDYLLDVRFTDEAFFLIQMDSEHHLMNILKQALSIVKKHTLYPENIDFVCNQMIDKKHITLTTFISFSGIDMIVKKIDSKLKLSESAHNQLNTLLNIIVQTILNKSNELMILKGSVKHIDKIEIKTSVKLILKGELYKHAIHNANKEKKLLLSVENIDFKDKPINYLIGILEYITEEILILSVDFSKNNIISTKNIKNAIDNDEELLRLIKVLHIWFIDN